MTSTPAWWPRRWYYGWALVIALGVTATVSYGILAYGFAVFITPMGEELGWSKAQITGAFSVSQLVLGVVAIPLGRWVDRRGARALMTAGSVLATILLIAWSRVQSLEAFYLIWAMMGVALAAVLYEPAFAVVATWFRHGRGRALTLLTFIGGFASVVFVPLTTTLVSRFGWRSALVWLAAIYAALTVVPHALVLRRRPADLGLVPDGNTRAPSGREAIDPVVAGHSSPDESFPSATAVVRSRPFRWLALAFALAALSSTVVTVHFVPLLIERGFSPAFAGGAMGVLGLMALPGRLIFTPLGDRLPRASVTASIFVLQIPALAAMLLSESALAVWVFVLLFGAGFGAITPARAALLADRFGHANYGSISGVLALLVAFARAVAPVGASVVYEASRATGVLPGYDAVLAALLLVTAGAAAAVLASA
ncbi:MAG TPA: MFS transporter [Gemmatimonadaceae bacterium]|nr:MFS transporter [Gemmatimonadaceae bacterium]